jgi:phosphoinositide-3-kinase regulatory subunit 4
MIKDMINLDPSSRPTFDTILHTSRGTIFPESFFSFLHNYVASINELPASNPFINAPVPSAHVAIPSVSAGTSTKQQAAPLDAVGVSDPPTDLLPSDSDHRMEKVWADYESVEPYLVMDTADPIADVEVEYQPSASASKPFQVSYGDYSLHSALIKPAGCPPSRASHPK